MTSGKSHIIRHVAKRIKDQIDHDNYLSVALEMGALSYVDTQQVYDEMQVIEPYIVKWFKALVERSPNFALDELYRVSSYIGEPWPTVKKAVSDAKPIIMKDMIERIRRTPADMDYRDFANERLEKLEFFDVKWPELDILRAQMDTRLDEGPRRLTKSDVDDYIQIMSNGFDHLRTHPKDNIFPLNLITRFQRMIRYDSIPERYILSRLDTIKNKVIAYLVINVKNPSNWWEIRIQIRELKELGVKWPELNALEKKH